MGRLGRSFFDVPCHTLARRLLGKRLCRRLPAINSDADEVIVGTIVETEMYPGKSDSASHSHRGRSGRNGAMFMTPGTVYVYIIYGVYHCFNVSSQEIGGAVLVRALEPVSGLSAMRSQRALMSRTKSSPRHLPDRHLCNGPSKLCSAMAITKSDCNELDLVSSNVIWIEDNDDLNNEDIFVSTRIGIDNHGHEVTSKLYRFYIKANPCVSVLDTNDPNKRSKRKAVDSNESDNINNTLSRIN